MIPDLIKSNPGFFMYAVFFEIAPKAETGGHDQDAQSDNSGCSNGSGACCSKGFHIATDGMIHGIVGATAGDHREDGNHQIGNGGEFSHSCHDLCIQCGSKAGYKETNQVISCKLIADIISCPGYHTAKDTDQDTGPVDIK